MWKSYPEYNMTSEQWLDTLFTSWRSYDLKALSRCLMIMSRQEEFITKVEEKTLRKMLSSSKEDAYIALTIIENKYKLKDDNTN